MKPLVTVGILSWNRFKYLKATLLSARECIQYPRIEWIVSDNASTEPGLAEFLNEQRWIDKLLIKSQSHAEAMNEILDQANGEYLILWPEDVQFVIKGKWLEDLIEVMESNKDIGSMCLCHLRATTMKRVFRPWYRDFGGVLKELSVYRSRFRFSRLCIAKSGLKVMTYGWRKCGVCPSGIPSLTRTSIWKELGGWKARDSARGLVDSSCGAEDNMLYRFFSLRKTWQRAIPFVPVAADIITDPLGCKAKIRGSYRYGVYMAPPNPPFYYRIDNYEDYLNKQGDGPRAFMEAVVPLGFSLPTDENGDCRKCPINESVMYSWKDDRAVASPLEEIEQQRREQAKIKT